MRNESQKTFDRIPYRYPMLSPETGFQDQDIIDFDARTSQLLKVRGPIEYAAAPKIDGLPVELVYERGALTIASMKGDGFIGENITPHIKTILTVPLSLIRLEGAPPIPELLVVQGQVYMEMEAFETLNRERRNKQQSPFVDLNQTVEESLRHPNPKVAARRPLSMFCDVLGEMSGVSFETHLSLMIALQAWGLRINRPFIRVSSRIDEIIEYCHSLEGARKEFPFPSDGALIEVNRLDLQAKLSGASRHHRWAFLYQFGQNG